MPRKNERLPYVQLNRVGRLSYVRRIRPEIREFLGGKATIRRSLGVKSTDCAEPAVIAAWSAVNTAVEALIAEAKAQQAGQSEATTEVTPLSPRDIAGIAAEPWRKLLKAGDEGQINAEIQALLAEAGGKAMAALVSVLETGDIQRAEQMNQEIATTLLADVVNQLQITPDQKTYEKMQKRLQGYAGDIRRDLEARAEGDFGSSVLGDKAPPLPKRKVTWQQVLEQYRISVGGTTESNGQGVGEYRIGAYQNAITDFVERTGKHFPDEITIDDARAYANALQQSQLAISTQQKKYELTKNLYKVAVVYGLIDDNPLLSIRIKRPKGSTVKTYRSFTREELVRIFEYLNQTADESRQWVINALLCTGCRGAEILCLRTKDIKMTNTGIYYFDFVHRPQDQYPTSLKGGGTGERKTPWHQRLNDRGYHKSISKDKDTYLMTKYTPKTSSWSAWFRDKILKQLDIYEHGSTGLHSLRNTAKDLWREAGIDAEFRRALVAHAAKDVQDRVYGSGLKNMPDVLAKEINKLDLNWLP